MDDLISRAAALNALLMSKDYRDARDALEQLPAVDAAPVVHGMWIYFNCVGNGRYQCSECFHWIDAGTDRNYCPNCGAKMDKEA